MEQQKITLEQAVSIVLQATKSFVGTENDIDILKIARNEVFLMYQDYMKLKSESGTNIDKPIEEVTTKNGSRKRNNTTVPK